jgi:hypothetical protein
VGGAELVGQVAGLPAGELLDPVVAADDVVDDCLGVPLGARRLGAELVGPDVGEHGREDVLGALVAGEPVHAYPLDVDSPAQRTVSDGTGSGAAGTEGPAGGSIWPVVSDSWGER